MDAGDVPSDGLTEPAGMVSPPSVVDFPPGYRYGVTRYADLILREALPERYGDLLAVLSEFRIDVEEIFRGGGNRTAQNARFDSLLKKRGWGKRNIKITKLIDDKLIHSTRGHEINMFGPGTPTGPYPGVAVEMEWNNKDPFFDRDLINFAALHREGALAVGIIVTRGPTLQGYISQVIRSGSDKDDKRYGTFTTHWEKIVPRINLGGGGGCPLIVVGIEPERIDGFEVVVDAFDSGRFL